MPLRTLSTVDSLAQYVLVSRLAALALTATVFGAVVSPRPWLLFPFGVLLAFNYLALRHWPDAVIELRIAAKPFYLALDITLSAAVLAVVGAGAPLALYLVGTVALAGLVYPRGSTLTAQVAVFGAFEVVHWTRLGYLPGRDDVHTLITLPALILGGGFVGRAVRRLVDQNERAADQIGSLKAQAAVREERLRVARDLHDTVTKNLHGLWLVARGLDAALAGGDLATARSSAALIATTAGDLAAQSRDVITGLRDHDLSRPPDEQTLDDVVRRTVAGQPLEANVSGSLSALGALPDRVRGEVLSIVAEALHNTVKHAAARRVDVLLDVLVDAGAETLVVTVTDDGCGFGDGRKAGHYGLAGMRERARLVGGTLDITSRPGAGTRVELRVPAPGAPTYGRTEGTGIADDLHDRAAC